jgi:hypothetical protein
MQNDRVAITNVKRRNNYDPMLRFETNVAHVASIENLVDRLTVVGSSFRVSIDSRSLALRAFGWVAQFDGLTTMFTSRPGT